MADVKITDLTALTTPAAGDYLEIVDVSDTTDSAEGSSKKISYDDLVSDAVAAHTGDASDAHDASAISVVDAGGYYTGTDVEGVLQELPSRFAPKATYPWSVTVALSDMTTQITTGTTKAYWVNPFDTTLTLTKVKATLATAGSGSTVVDVNEGAGAGTTILSTKITIDASETDSDDATGAVISDATIAADGRITFDIDTAGTSAAGLQVTLIGTRVLA